MKYTKLAQLTIIILGVIFGANDAYASGSSDGWAGLALLIVAVAAGIPAIVTLIVLICLCARYLKQKRIKPTFGMVVIIISIFAILSLPALLFFGIVFDYTTVTSWEYFASGCALWIPVIILGTVSAVMGGKIRRVAAIGGKKATQ